MRTCRPFAANQTKVGTPYWNSENDLVDGIMPQWGGTLTPGMSWPQTFLLNYIVANGSATMLCPFIHGWNQNLGRHNHGYMFAKITPVLCSLSGMRTVPCWPAVILHVFHSTSFNFS